MMRRYERRRAGVLAGTEGSRAPWFPVESPPVIAQPPQELEAVATSGVVTPPPPEIVAPAAPAAEERVRSSAPRPRSSPNGVWVDYAGDRWYSAGAAVPATSGAFVRIGNYYGFEVFREGGRADEIYVETVAGGLLAPYTKR
jgi:hypothetical protein